MYSKTFEKAKNTIKNIEEKLKEYNDEDTFDMKEFQLGVISLKLKTVYNYIKHTKQNNQELENLKIKYRNLVNQYRKLKDKLDKEFDESKNDYLG